MTKYIGMDAHSSTCTFCVMNETGEEIDHTTLETNGRLLVTYLRSIEGVKTSALTNFGPPLLTTTGPGKP